MQEQLVAIGPRTSFPLAGNKISTEPSIPEEWLDEDYRQAAMESTVENLIAWQVRINREERDLTQAELARRMGTKQSAISKLEDPEGGDVLVSTLVKAAHAFDCALVIRFVDYGRFAVRTHDVAPSRLFACGFGDLIQTNEVLQGPRP
ncbi:helix-turn-helix domain-containing protein [Pelomonas sp. KK5]|uniref:helix-turn-helix domain-containing protein n=1 Tax=Pelomonas sp. KK5 TaxID=1855730 RepID=UPI0018EA1336|nr:helix-turn-helix transcriptional regulator [Pelomonas sp. KK5]